MFRGDLNQIPPMNDTFEVTLLRDVPEGYCLAHHDGRTWFVRHGIAGERVRVRVESIEGRIGRASVVEVLQASPHRTPPPCQFAGRCGGCDYQHVDLGEQRQTKSRVLQDALRRQGGFVDPPLFPVQPVPGDIAGLRWRKHMRWQQNADGARGLYQHRTHDIVEIDDCLIAQTDADEPQPGVFSQAHIGLPAVLRQRIQVLGRPMAGEHWWDLYAGAGELSSELASEVGSSGRVDLVESSPASATCVTPHSDGPLHVHVARVEHWVAGQTSVDGVVVDPPRSGLPRSVIGDITACRPRVIISISCQPVTFARDLAHFAEDGYVATSLEAFDAYPMTWHMELVAALTPQDAADQILLTRKEGIAGRG